jgi:hypothetical protein
VHVVAEVRDDEREVGQLVRGEVAGKLRERDDAVAARMRARHVPEVQERVVLLRVAARRAAGEATVGRSSAYVFQVFPAAAGVSARLRAWTTQSVQSLVIPCVEPETSAR